MSILRANLKHLYQRRGLWFVYALVCMIMPAMLIGIYKNYLADGAEGQKGLFVALLALSNIAGLFACSMQIDIAIKPFSHCLPGHRNVKRQFLLIVAVVTSLLFSLIFLLYPNITSTDKFMAVVAAFFAGMISFWIGTFIAFSGNASAAFLGFYPVIGIIISKYDLHIAAESAIVAEPGAVCIAGVVVSIAAWMLLSCEGWFRRHCGSQWLGLFDAWNWGKVRKYNVGRVDSLEDGLLLRVFERLCLSRVKNAAKRVKGSFVGSIYATFGHAFCKGLVSVIISFSLLLVIVCCLGYIKNMVNMLYILAGMLAVNVRMPVHSTMLIAGGRRERFISTFFMAAVVAVLISGVVTLLALITRGIDTTGILPKITLGGSARQFHPFSMLGFYIPFIMVPVGFTIQLIFKRQQIPMMVAWVMFFMFCFIAAMFVDAGNIYWVYAIAATVAASWIVFLAVLRWVCMRRPLVI